MASGVIVARWYAHEGADSLFAWSIPNSDTWCNWEHNGLIAEDPRSKRGVSTEETIDASHGCNSMGRWIREAL